MSLISSRWRWHTNVTWCQTCILLGNVLFWPCHSRRCLVCKNSLARPELESTRGNACSLVVSFLASLLLRALLEMKAWISQHSIRELYWIRKTNNKLRLDKMKELHHQSNLLHRYHPVKDHTQTQSPHFDTCQNEPLHFNSCQNDQQNLVPTFGCTHQQKILVPSTLRCSSCILSGAPFDMDSPPVLRWQKKHDQHIIR
jgi:hypothetical protein